MAKTCNLIRFARVSVCFLAYAGVWWVPPVLGAQPSSTVVDYRALLDRYCVGCHNADDKQGRLDLSSHKAMLQGGKNGAVITPKHANLSRVVRVLNGDAKPAMPAEDNEAPNDS